MKSGRADKGSKIENVLISILQCRMHVPYGCDEAGGEGAVGEPQQKATLSHTCLVMSHEIASKLVI